MFPPMFPPQLRKRLGTLALLVALACLCIGSPARAQSAQDITSLFSVTQSAPVLDRVNRVYYSYVNLTNTSGATVAGRLRLVVADSTLPVSNLPAPPDGTTADGKPYYWLGEGEQTYAAGASSGNRRVNFELLRARLVYGVRVEIMAEAAALVPPSGGVLEITDLASPAFGVRLEIPAGALAEGQVININAVIDPPAFRDGRQGVGSAIDLGPSGTTFDVPVSITFNYDPADLEAQGILSPSSLRAYTYDSERGAWLPIETVAVTGNTVVATTTHFSTFMLNGDRLESPWPLCAEGATPCTTDSPYPPVLFVHGVQPFGDPYGDWYGTFGGGPGLLSQNNVDVYHLAYNSSKDIRDSAVSLALAVRRIKSETGKPFVNVIAHSMGGLVARAYLQGLARPRFVTVLDPALAAQLAYQQDIGKLMMRGTPNHGSVYGVAQVLRGESYLQMLPGSGFLTELNERSAFPDSVVLEVAYGSGIPTATCEAGRMDWCIALAAIGVDPWSWVDGDGVVPAVSALVGPDFDVVDVRRLQTHPPLDGHAHTVLPLFPLAVAHVRVTPESTVYPGDQVAQQMLAFALDRDVDGSADAEDACPDTLWPARTDPQGCSFEQQRPTLLSPAPDAVGVDPDDVKLTWLPMQHPDIGSQPVVYCFVLNEDAEPTDRVVYDSCALGHFLEAPAYGTSLDPNKRYWWAVWAKDAKGKWARPSDWQTFRTGYKTTLLTSLENFGEGGYVVNLRIDGSDITNITVREPIAGVQQVDAQTFVLTLSGRPNVADRYTIDITHADGSRETYTWTVPAVNDNFPTITDPADGGTVANVTPAFTWIDAPETTWYTVKVTEITPTGETPIWITTHVAVGSVGAQSVVFNQDGTAAGDLLSGAAYRLYVSGMNAAGSFATAIADFTVAALDHPDFTDPTTGMQFAYVAPGTFQMGDTFGDGYDWERPVHTVTLTQGYYMGTTEVTQAQWQQVMGSNPSYFQPSRGYPVCPECPVEQVSWNDIQVFLATLNAQTGRSYRLPTEAEWEYAAKGGPYSQGYKYAGSNNVDEVAWHWTGAYGSHPVGQKLPNELGLYDMSGNVWEWVQDWWSYYSAGAQTDPTGPATGSYRVIRGGGWHGGALDARVSRRDGGWPGPRSSYFGFRLALSQ